MSKPWYQSESGARKTERRLARQIAEQDSFIASPGRIVRSWAILPPPKGGKPKKGKRK
jgi:hypothetical protein